MRAQRKTLRGRLTLVCALLTIAALTLTGLDSWRRESSSLAENTRNQLETLARMVAINSRTGVEFSDTSDVMKSLRVVTEAVDLQAIAVYLHDGRRFAIDGDANLLPRHLDIALAEHSDRVARVALPYNDDGVPREGTVLVRASGETDRARVRAHVMGMVVTAVTALFALGFAARWLLARLLRPVAALVDTTHLVRQTEDYTLRASANADDEIGDLVHAFNGMLQTIQERDRNLAENAQRLEQQVRERTSELSRAVETAESATRAKSTFVANMSHEIRTPLNAVLGMAELAMETEDPREQREYLDVIRSAGANLLGILSDILDLSKIESEKLELSPVPTEIESLVLEALRPLTSRIQSKELELSFDLAPELARAYLVDDVRLRQVLTNLVGNAVKFTAKGFVRVELQVCSEHGNQHELELSVQDSGVGIPSDRLQAIFAPFTQADSTITRRFAGTGLGLSITDRLVHLMGGSIHVESTLGVGTTFRVRLRLTVCDSPLPPPPTLAGDTRILVVSRSPSLQRTLATIGRRLRVGIVLLDEPRQLATQGALREHDIVLLDDRDPDQDAGVCDALPIGPLGVRSLFIATSFQDLASTSARCRRNQYGGYVTKPISGRELAVRFATLQGGTRSEAAAVATATAPAPGGPERLRILVAEDNAVNQKLIERILGRDGHAVTMAENGHVCCQLWSRGTFDLILMDMQMPEMSGLEAAAWIRREESNTGRRVPIIALTANTTPEDRRACLHAGMDEMLPKPVSIPRLRAVLADIGATTESPVDSAAPGKGNPA